MQSEASPLESADTHIRAKSDDLAQTCFGAPPGVGDCPRDNPEPNCCGRKPANKKSSPKQDLSEEKFTGSR